MHTIQATTELKRLMTAYFQGMRAPVAWCTSVGPAELLRSFGFEVYFPENHGALLGATRTSGDLIPAAVKAGYSGDICSYLTSDIGAHLSGTTPLKKQYGLDGPPRPDLIVYNTNQCREVQDWFTYFAKEHQAPVFGITPPRYLDQVTDVHVQDVAKQFEALVPLCEQITGTTFDIDRFRETLRLSREATELWKSVLATATNSPAPINFFDATIHMGPIVVLRGTQEAKDYYALLLKELQGMVARGEGAVAKEACRIYWDGMPIWGKLRTLSELFAKNSAAVVASTYCNSWVFDAFDERDPFASSALAYTEIFINRSERAKTEILTRMVKDFRIDGVIFHDAKTCFNNSNARFGMPQRLKEQAGVETLVLEGDLCDLRFYSEGQSHTKIEAFIEQLT
ncbi:MAG: 2-hydroxyacyl-CoA dehydratase [Flavobacteriales bacterium]|jgi:benzoyl-CoA reductase/2-hydroxyglutaryl-CoA dehydratase subunit BcrC/BadD/HgdB|nr:2-hydroxyacyl-CoA dehydratase [Flavobacteriales bacterium]MBK6884167.1 2-hydroxyacyl-CoA dehydratase [Flavobacteriales bacterium]MBK7111243.1 2-hydroxyacyl-CoA dehydratase [Flavobacteriales bacterium]MBK8533123.1 2-hydroxyacyl-CoA dehydratase [Flavobacteriales bacterium]MBK8707404.1 2-hydroxyacyl-CoA dehydratase [Flavobacteriales bacterium]